MLIYGFPGELRKTACCLGIDHCILADYLVTSQLMTGNGEVISKLCTVGEATWRKDCLAKCVYERYEVQSTQL